MNTEISYLYRDGCNFKRQESIVVVGEVRFRDIAPYLHQGTDFIPGQVGLEALNNYDAEIDGPYHELSEGDFKPTEGKATAEMTAEQLIEAFRQAHEDGWDESFFDTALIERLAISDRLVQIPEKAGRSGPVAVRVQSEVFGTEEFAYSSLKDAIEGMICLYDEAIEQSDTVERIIGLVVNPEK